MVLFGLFIYITAACFHGRAASGIGLCAVRKQKENTDDDIPSSIMKSSYESCPRCGARETPSQADKSFDHH